MNEEAQEQSRQAAWQQKQRDEHRCISCTRKDKRTKAGHDRCAKCNKGSRDYNRNYKREKLGLNPWKPGGRGRPPKNKALAMKELEG
jgi:hypothetical protein